MIFVRPQHEVEERTRAIRADFRRRYDTDALREQLYREQEGLCAICKKAMQDSSGIICHIDHAVSVYMIANWDWDIDKACEVANAKRNLQAVHVACGAMKREADYEEFCAAIQRGEIVLGEIPELTAERIVALKTALTERCRKGGRNGSREAKAKAGRKRFELRGSPATLEGCIKGGRKGGRNQPREAKAKGARKRNEIYGNPATLESCAKGGRKNVANGQLARIASLGARKRNEIHGNPATPESCVKGGRKGSRTTNHTRWHLRRGVVNPRCALCQKDSLPSQAVMQPNHTE